MNDYVLSVRRRRRTLLIVEGDDEKNMLFWALFRAFPEMAIKYDDVWIYGTNIYMLYKDIVKEYGTEWLKNKDDIDLPFVISKKITPSNIQYKEDFSDIFLVFDYERHDPGFSENRIVDMQNYFYDSTDMGKLYINYPMLESYQHFESLPDLSFENRHVSVLMNKGSNYKNEVHKTSVIGKIVWFPHKTDEILEYRFHVLDSEKRRVCINSLLKLDDEHNLPNQLPLILKNVVESKDEATFMCQLIHEIRNLGVMNNHQSYWEYMRQMFKRIIYYNACKANKIQNGKYEISEEEYKNVYTRLELSKILEIQNEASRDKLTGIIWVLNTCVFLVADYNFRLLTE